MVPPLLRQVSATEHRLRGLESVMEYHRCELARLRGWIEKARAAGGVYRRHTLAGLRKALRGHRRGLTRAVGEWRAWAGTASPTTWTRLRWLWAIERLRREIWSRWADAAHYSERIAYWQTCISEQRFTPATRRSYAREIERFTKFRDEAVSELQELSEIAVRGYYGWAAAAGLHGDPTGARTEPYLDAGEAWLKRQLEGLGP